MPLSGATATVVRGVSAATSFARLYYRQYWLPEAREVLAPAAAEIAEGNDCSPASSRPGSRSRTSLDRPLPTKSPERMAASLRGGVLRHGASLAAAIQRI